uniref:Proton pump-interactor 1 n=1 Tax=Anthurium amnicola TaxID=1678845 RepID=A0A1D1Y7U6_9ARAE
MGVEILTDDSTSRTVEDATEQNNAFLSDMDKNAKLGPGQDLEQPINFGLVDSTQGTNIQTKAEANDAKNASFPKDAVDEWPAPKQIHTFYLVKYQSYEDPKLKAKLEQVDKEIQKRSKERFQITEALKEKRTERSLVISQLKPLTAEDKQYRVIIDGKRKEMEPLQAALGKLRNANNAERGMGLCSSEEELDNLIQSLHYRIQHESNTLAEEKLLLKDIKHLEGTREKVIAHAAMKAKLQDSLGPKEAIQDQVKLIGVDLDGVRKEQQAVRAKIRSLEDVLKAIDEDIGTLQEELASVTEKKDKAYEALNEHRKARDEGNASYYQNRALLNNARDLAAKKDIAALEELSCNEVEKFMSQWSGNKGFRDDYEKRILSSLDKRQLSRDGRMRNPDEKPIVSPVVASTESEVSLLAASRKVDIDMKPPKVDVEAPAQHIPSKKASKDDVRKLTGPETKGKAAPPEETETFFLSEKGQKDSAAPEVDAAKLKEMKRGEEIAKAKQASERKKKLSEKAAAKAAVRAQKEAEKKQKEREKKAKKKAAAVVLDTPDEQTEVETKAEESQEMEAINDAQIPSKVKEAKETVRYRIRSKGPDQRPKVIIPKKKKSSSYWLWAASVAAASVLALLILGYYFYYGRN